MYRQFKVNNYLYTIHYHNAIQTILNLYYYLLATCPLIFLLTNVFVKLDGLEYTTIY